MAFKVTKAEFVRASARAGDYPPPGKPEVAFAGRSNVGKSSLINTLLARRKLARTSSKPGHTRSINFFNVNDALVFADLPGYGYAKVSKQEREEWRRLIEDYLKNRDPLRAVVLIMDIRRVPGEEEKSLVTFLTAEGVTPILVATKADKLSANKRVKPLRELARAFGLDNKSVIVFSSATGEGKKELWAKIFEIAGLKS